MENIYLVHCPIPLGPRLVSDILGTGTQGTRPTAVRLIELSQRLVDRKWRKSLNWTHAWGAPTRRTSFCQTLRDDADKRDLGAKPERGEGFRTFRARHQVIMIRWPFSLLLSAACRMAAARKASSSPLKLRTRLVTARWN